MSTAEGEGESLQEQFAQFREDYELLRKQIGRVIVGQEEVIDKTLTALFAGGHVLLEGVPGLGKTQLVRTLADTLDLDFRRIQFTPDLMPADIVGTYVVLETHGRRKFELQQGPIFTHILLADEINRATPKTQSALLEGMQEGRATVANMTYELPEPFFVMATQSQSETEGTYPLPETQLDRFFFKLQVPFPTSEEIETILDRTTESTEPVAQAVLKDKRILEMMELARAVAVAGEVRGYAIALLLATHPEHGTATPMTRRFVRQGASPRGAQAMILAAKIRALLDGRQSILQGDLRDVALPVLRHRLTLNFEGHVEQIDPDQILREVLDTVSESAKSA